MPSRSIPETVTAILSDGREYFRYKADAFSTRPLKECGGDGILHWHEVKPPGEFGYNMAEWCKCLWAKKISERFYSTVGERDNWVKLSTLTPSDKSKLPIPVQEKCIAAMKADPSGSYAMLGGSGTSKTTLAVALYRCSLNANMTEYEHVIRIKAKTLLETIQAMRYDDTFNRDAAPPFTHAKKILNADRQGITTHLFLEELEKVKFTENRATELFDVIDAIYETKGQLVVTGNLTYADLGDTSKFMEGFARRIDEICEKHRWDFWKYAKEEVTA